MEVLRILRQSRGLTQDDVADGAGLCRETISMIERGKTSPKAVTLEKLCNFYDVTPDEILTTNAFKKIYRRLMKENALSRWGGRAADARLAFDMGVANGYIEEKKEAETYVDWRNPSYFAFETDKAIAIKNSTAKELMVSGPTRCGKTTLIIDTIIGRMIRNFGTKVLIARNTSVDLFNVRQNIREANKYRPDDPDNPFKFIGGNENFYKIEINGGFILMIGMNNPGKALGDDYDMVWYNQAEFSDINQHQVLITRVGGTAGNWKDEHGNVLRQFIYDANPDRDDHYLYLRKDELDSTGQPLMEWYDFGFGDSPLFYRNGVRTPEGEDFITDQEERLFGIHYDRKFLGIWGSPEGAIFELPGNCLLEGTPTQEQIKSWDIFRACDWGMSAPSTCLWIGEDPETNNTYVFREWAKTHTDIVEMGKEVNSYTGHEKVKETIIDNDENRQKLLRKQCGISSKMARKGPNSIMDGIFLIQSALRNTKEGKDGGLYIYQDLRCNNDPHPDAKKYSENLIAELKGAVYDQHKDAPKKGQDHRIDPLRYYYLYRSMKTEIPMIFSTVKKKQRKN